MSARYAIYAAPEPDSALAAFGAAVLGYDAAGGRDAPFLLPDGLTAEAWRDLTAAPRTYGFHGTLKAPFALAGGRSPEELAAAARRLAAGRAPLAVPLAVARLGRFVALVPAGPAPALDGLAAAAVDELDRFRAPLAEKDRERRLASGLSERQSALLERWGYPYVFDQFRFHMTLTGSLPPDTVDSVRDRLAALVGAELGAPVLELKSLALFVQPGPGERFAIAGRFPLGTG